MKRMLLAATLLLLSQAHSAAAAQPEKSYFLGEAKLSSDSGKPMGSQVLLVEKTQDPDKNLISERAIVVKADGSAEQYTMNMTVDGNSFKLKDAANTTTGTGTLFGPAWQWTYFKGTFQASNGVRIEDENFLSDPSIGVARKKIIGPDGKVILYMDVVLKSITPQTFEVLAAALLKK